MKKNTTGKTPVKQIPRANSAGAGRRKKAASPRFIFDGGRAIPAPPGSVAGFDIAETMTRTDETIDGLMQRWLAMWGGTTDAGPVEWPVGYSTPADILAVAHQLTIQINQLQLRLHFVHRHLSRRLE